MTQLEHLDLNSNALLLEIHDVIGGGQTLAPLWAAIRRLSGSLRHLDMDNNGQEDEEAFASLARAALAHLTGLTCLK